MELLLYKWNKTTAKATTVAKQSSALAVSSQTVISMDQSMQWTQKSCIYLSCSQKENNVLLTLFTFAWTGPLG